jgi:hypothetical protein
VGRIRRGARARAGLIAAVGALSLAAAIVPTAPAAPAGGEQAPAPTARPGALVSPAPGSAATAPAAGGAEPPQAAAGTQSAGAQAPGTQSSGSQTTVAQTPQAPGSAPAATPSTTPTLALTPGIESLAAQWSVSGATGLAGFRVRYRPVAVPAQPWSAPLDLPAGSRRYALTGLAPRPYEVLVRVLLAGGRTGGAASVRGTPLPGEEPPLEEAPAEAPSCNLYAANGGSDTNPGTAAAPFRSLKHLIVSLAAGQTGCLRSGQTFDAEPDSTGRGSINVHAGESHGQPGAPVTITSTNPSEPAVISHSLSLDGGADWLTFTHLRFVWMTGQCSWSALGVANNCPAESHVQIAISAKDVHFTWDEISNYDTNICVNIVKYDGYTAFGTVLEHDVIHDCGVPVHAPGEPGYHVHINEEPGWHEHGVYDYGDHTTVRNNYLYNISRAALLFYPSGNGAVVEHNVIDHSGAGVWLAGTANVTVRGNIITDAYSPRGEADVGIGSDGPGFGNVVEHNCLYGNRSGEISVDAPPVQLLENLPGSNPLYVNAAQHDYELRSGSPCAAEAPQ